MKIIHFFKKSLSRLLLLLLFFTYFDTNAQSLQVMTYNIRLDVASDGENDWTHRKDYLTAQIQFYAPGIFGIQEALPHQVIDIATRLPNYNYVGIGRDGDGKGESSNIFYNKSNYKVLESDTFWLSETPNVVSRGWDAACNRVCTYALFEDSKSKKKFWVFNTHLDHMGQEARIKGITLIVNKIKAINTKDYAVLLMGDLNSEPDSDVIALLNNEMTDTRRISINKSFGASGTFNGFRFDEPVTKLIDYIFVSKTSGIIVKKHAVLSDSNNLRYPSDHLPVYVECILTK